MYHCGSFRAHRPMGRMTRPVMGMPPPVPAPSSGLVRAGEMDDSDKISQISDSGGPVSGADETIGQSEGWSFEGLTLYPFRI